MVSIISNEESVYHGFYHTSDGLACRLCGRCDFRHIASHLYDRFSLCGVRQRGLNFSGFTRHGVTLLHPCRKVWITCRVDDANVQRRIYAALKLSGIAIKYVIKINLIGLTVQTINLLSTELCLTWCTQVHRALSFFIFFYVTFLFYLYRSRFITYIINYINY